MKSPSKAAIQAGPASRLRHARMQSDDELPVALILRRHQSNRLPGGREDDETSAGYVLEVGAEPPRLHRHRPIR